MRAVVRVVAVAVLVAAAGACAPSEGTTTTYPPASIGPDRTVSPGVGPTRAAIVAALAAQDITLRDAQEPVRPAEAPMLALAPRAVYQAILPDDPGEGYIVVYEFRDSAQAASAAAEQQAYLSTGPAIIQSPEGSVQVIRGLGSTVILYDWLPAAAKDERAPGVQAALETLGTGYLVVR